jgi:hypothetical protein
MLERPSAGEYDPFYDGYIARVTEDDVLHALAGQPADVEAMARRFSPDRESHAYAPGKWTVRELIGHVTDSERVFGYRAVCIARGDKASFPGFDENTYVARSNFGSVPLADLVHEFALLREANVAAFRRFDDRAWSEVGTGNGVPVTPRALAFIMAGHVRHHLHVLAERYAPR